MPYIAKQCLAKGLLRFVTERMLGVVCYVRKDQQKIKCNKNFVQRSRSSQYVKKIIIENYNQRVFLRQMKKNSILKMCCSNCV